MNIIQQIIEWFLAIWRRLFLRPPEIPVGDMEPNFGPDPDPALRPQPVTRKVLMITHNPTLPSKGGQTVREYFQWNDPEALAQQYIEDMRWASFGYAHYVIAEHIVVDGFPVKQDGFQYDADSYLDAWDKQQFHQPDRVNYLKLVEDFDMIARIDSGAIDEVWLFGHPYGGYYESIMAGPGAFYCNAPPLAGTEHASRRFVIMGFNFERGVGEMFEDLGHRAESMLVRLFEGVSGEANVWERFIRYDKTHPGLAECGNVHFAPNSERDYDWGNRRPVWSRCDTWFNFPDLHGEAKGVDCREWGSGDMRIHHLWWLRHFPHITGSANGIAYNWWETIIDPNGVR